MSAIENNTVRAIVEDIAVPIRSGGHGSADDAEACRQAARILKSAIGKSPSHTRVRKKSVDARRKNNVRLVYSVFAELDGLSPSQRKRLADAGIKTYSEPSFDPEIEIKIAEE